MNTFCMPDLFLIVLYAAYFMNVSLKLNANLQVEIINQLPEGKTITVYRCGPLVDLCRGPHIPNTSFVKAFACLKVMFVFWTVILNAMLMDWNCIHVFKLILRVLLIFRLHPPIGGASLIGKVFKEFMEFLFLNQNVSRCAFIFSYFTYAALLNFCYPSLKYSHNSDNILLF